MLTLSDVKSVMNELQVCGVTPTSSLVREKLGKGSFSTITKFMKVVNSGVQVE